MSREESTKRLPKLSFPEIDEAMFDWLLTVGKKAVCISGKRLQEVALAYAQDNGIKNFKASNGWFQRFQERHGLRFKVLHGNSKSTNNVVRYKIPNKSTPPRREAIIA